jgi:hypothetical protein
MPNSLTQTVEENASGVLNANAAMTRSGGAIGTRWVNGGTGCPDNWTTGNNGGATVGLTATLSRELRADGEYWWKIVISGQPATTGAELTLNSAITFSGISDNAHAFTTGHLEWTNAVNMHTIALRTLHTGGTTNRGSSFVGAQSLSTGGTDPLPATSGGSGKHRSAACKKVTGTSAMTSMVYIRPDLAGVDTSATIYVRDITARLYADAPL